MCFFTFDIPFSLAIGEKNGDRIDSARTAYPHLTKLDFDLRKQTGRTRRSRVVKRTQQILLRVCKCFLLASFELPYSTIHVFVFWGSRGIDIRWKNIFGCYDPALRLVIHAQQTDGS